VNRSEFLNRLGLDLNMTEEEFCNKIKEMRACRLSVVEVSEGGTKMVLVRDPMGIHGSPAEEKEKQ
jgi:hypothetical protein